MKEKVLELMAANDHCVMSTVSPQGNPQSALVGFSFNDKLEVTVGTYRHTRKYKNILSNPHVSIVIASEASKLEVQYEGNATELKGEELKLIVGKHYKDKEVALQRLKDPSRVFLKISPRWIRYVDANVDPIHFEERQFS